MKKLSREQAVFLIALFVFLLACAGYWYTLTRIHALHFSVEELRAKHTALVANALVQSKTSEEIDRLEPLQAELDSHIVQKDFPTPLLSELEQLERILGLPIQVRSITHSTADSQELTLEVALTFSGSWNEVYGALQALEQMSFITKVHQFVLQYGEVKDEKEGWTGTVYMRAMVR